MTNLEFSNEFDTLLSSYLQQQNLGIQDSTAFDEYEKSVFLTKAQESIVVELYNGKNPYNDSFEKTEELRRYLEKLVITDIITDKESGYNGLSDSSVFYKLPDKLWFITYESVVLNDTSLGCLNGERVIVIPVTQDDYWRISRNPFREANKNKVLRLDISDNIVELISKYNISSYLVRYIERPEPIILQTLNDGLSINNVSKETECKLNSALHRGILEKAVKLAVLSRTHTSAG
jgi:hypothetical protein